MDVLTDPPFTLPECTLLPADPVAEFDQMAALTRRVLDVPAAQVNLVDREQQVFPARRGSTSRRCASERPRSSTRSASTSSGWAEPLIVPDAREHPMLRNNPAIAENGVVAYAGMPLRDLHDTVIGTLCVFDDRPRYWSAEQVETLSQLAVGCSACPRCWAVRARRHRDRWRS